MSAQSVRPSRLWYVLAGALVVGAGIWLTAGLLLGFRSLERQIREFQRVPVPGEREVRLERQGGYTLYFEGPGASDATRTVQSLTVSLVPAGGGTPVSIRRYDTSATYDLAGHSGRAVGAFRIDRPGSFLLRVQGEPGAAPSNVAVGTSIAPVIVRALVPTIPGAIVLFLVGVAVVVVVAIRRNQARRTAAGPAVPAGPPAYGPIPPGWFADPSGRHELRYWDGRAWTASVSDRGTQTHDPPTATPPA
jgi:Protein of unknown function (DUF2510)